MRSVILMLFNTDAQHFVRHLDRKYQRSINDWLLKHPDDDTALYVTVQPLEIALSAEAEQKAMLDIAAGRPFICAVADVSGPNDKKVLTFITDTLSTFDGLAFDDYTLHAWTMQEIHSGVCKDGHPFFDYLGWYNDPRMAR